MPRLKFWPTAAAAAAGVAVLAVVNFSLTQSLTPAGRGLTAPAPTPRPPAKLAMTVITDPACGDCSSLEPIIAAIAKRNVTVARTNLTRTDPAAQELFRQYKIEIIPSLVITGELDADVELASAWPRLGEQVGAAVVLKTPTPPYALAANGEVKGRVRLTLIGDERCTDCYDVNDHRQILSSFGVRDSAATTIDIRSAPGQQLRQKYGIREVPTVLLQGEVAEYAALGRIWPQVGTVEADGTYVLRSGVKDMGVYSDLASGAVVRPSPTPQPSPSNRAGNPVLPPSPVPSPTLNPRNVPPSPAP